MKTGETICTRCRWYDRQTYGHCNVGGKYHEWSVSDFMTGRNYHYMTPYFGEDCRSKNKGNCRDYAYQFPWNVLWPIAFGLFFTWVLRFLAVNR